MKRVPWSGRRSHPADGMEQRVRGLARVYITIASVSMVAFAGGVAKGAGRFFGLYGAAAATAAAAAVAGGLLGLIFGLPRPIESPEGARPRLTRFGMNSNLLKVSDWITTIIVGLTLVNLRSVPGAVRRLGDWLTPALGDRPASGAFGVALAVFSAVSGFVLVYHWSIIVLREFLEQEEAQLPTFEAITKIAESNPEKANELLQRAPRAVKEQVAHDDRVGKALQTEAKQLLEDGEQTPNDA